MTQSILATEERTSHGGGYVKGCQCERCEAERQRSRAYSKTYEHPDPTSRRQYKTEKQRAYDAGRLAELKTQGKKPCNGPLCNGAVKPFDEFYPKPGTKLGIESRCKACKNYARSLRPASDHTEQIERWRIERQQAIAIYGGHCDGCGDISNLEFDHVDNNGAEHRKTEEVKAMVHRIAELGSRLPDYRLRLLCGPCHRAISPKTGKPSRSYIEWMLATSNDWPVFAL